MATLQTLNRYGWCEQDRRDRSQIDEAHGIAAAEVDAAWRKATASDDRKIHEEYHRLKHGFVRDWGGR